MGYIPDEYYIRSYFSLIPVLLIYNYAYIYLGKKNEGSNCLYNFFDYSKKHINGRLHFSKKAILILVFLFICCFWGTLYICNFSISNLAFKGKYDHFHLKLIQPMELFFCYFIRPFCLILFLFYCLLGKNNYYKILLFLLSSSIILPTATPRHMAGILYIAVLLIGFDFFRKKNILSYSLTGGILYIFPLLNQTRYLTFTKFDFSFNPKFFISGHFDSFFSYIQITNHEVITWGKQLLGVIFFYVPRSLWPTKPIGSGYYYSEQLGDRARNIAVNYFAEGYINFGYLGILLFTILITYFCVIFDNTYWRKDCLINKNGFTILYYLSFGLLFFVLRDSLMSATAYTISLYSVVFMINCILKYVK